jgi:hypothetical protein
MLRIRTLQYSLPRLILLGSLLAVYLCTMAPGLSWANDGSDGGDLAAAAATGGVAHPTGYPLYLIVAHIFQCLPLGSLAFRTNLLSAVAMGSASALIYTLVQNRSAASPNNKYPWLPGLVAGYAAGLAPLIWSQAVITEVYGLQALLVAFILYLYTTPTPISPQARRCLDCWRGLILGMAAGNHVTTLLLLPPVIILGSINQTAEIGPGWLKSLRIDRGAFFRQLGMLTLGLCVYLIVPLRASMHPPVNWGNAISWERFWWLISAQLYRAYYLQPNGSEIWWRVQSVTALLLQQFGLSGVIMGLIGLIVFGRFSRLYLFTFWTAVIFTAFAVVYETTDSYIYLIPMILSFAIWIGLGIESTAIRIPRYSQQIRIMLSLLLLLALAGRAVINVDQVDASSDFRAEHFAKEVLSSAPANAILFAEGDRAVFTLWYFHFALGERPDLTVIAVDLLHFDWYQENLQANYPSLVLPTPFPWSESITVANPSLPVCYVQYSDATMIDCSPIILSP